MTAQDYLDLLPIVADRGWRVDEGGYIRDRDGRCPLCSLANEVDAKVKKRAAHISALISIGVSRTYGDRVIMFAADEPDSPLRPALMRALGMTQ